MPAIVVDFPEPVGPVIKIIPNGFAIAFARRSLDCRITPRLVRSTFEDIGSKIRITTFSPAFVGNVLTRKSYFVSPFMMLNRPSCGTRVSSILSEERIFIRVVTG